MKTVTLSLIYSIFSLKHVWLNKKDTLLTYSFIYRFIGLVGRVFANGPEDQGLIPGRVIPKTLKIVFDTSLLNT